jgi:hypothetical protein
MDKELEPLRHRPVDAAQFYAVSPELVPKNSDALAAFSGLTGPHTHVLEQRPNVCTAMAANLTGISRLQVGQTHLIAPAACVDHDGVRAVVVGAIDESRAGPDSRISAMVIFSRVAF